VQKRIIRSAEEQDAFTRWRRLYTRFQRPGTAKRVKQAANRYERHVMAKRDISEHRA